MKRYNIQRSNIRTEDEGLLAIEDPDGEWVKYEDHMESNKCCCAEEIQHHLLDTINGTNLEDGEIIFWICPAHGYKRF